MDLQPQASFIPKRPLSSSPISSTSGVTSILWVVALFIFIASCVAAAAVFSYTLYLNHQLSVAKDSLQRARAAFDQSSIEDLIRLSERMAQANVLLSSHLAPTTIFSFLEQNTLATARFTDFTYGTSPDGSVSIKLTGNAVDFASVALQSDRFGQATHVLKNVVFSGLNIDPSSGIVKFDVTANINPDVILYSNELANPDFGVTVPASSASTAAPSTTTASTTPIHTAAPPNTPPQ